MYAIPFRVGSEVSSQKYRVFKKETDAQDVETAKEMRNLGIEPRAPRRCSNGNGEFYH